MSVSRAPNAWMDIGFETDGLWQIVSELKATEKQAYQALGSTFSKMARWLRGRSVKGMSAELLIQQKIIRRRLKSFRMKGDKGLSAAKVWFGLNPVPFSDLRPKQTADGVSAAGGRHVKGAFMVKGRNGPRVLKRETVARLPLMTVQAEISEQAEKYIQDKIMTNTEFDRKFVEIFERELKWRTTTR